MEITSINSLATLKNIFKTPLKKNCKIKKKAGKPSKSRKFKEKLFKFLKNDGNTFKIFTNFQKINQVEKTAGKIVKLKKNRKFD